MRNSRYFDKVNLIGNNLKLYRTKLNISQDELCNQLALLGITLYKNDIYRIENNKRAVKDFELWGISKVLKVKYDDLLNVIE